MYKILYVQKRNKNTYIVKSFTFIKSSVSSNVKQIFFNSLFLFNIGVPWLLYDL